MRILFHYSQETKEKDLENKISDFVRNCYSYNKRIGINGEMFKQEKLDVNKVTRKLMFEKSSLSLGMYFIKYLYIWF